MLADRAKADAARDLGLSNELYRQLVDARKARFVAAFNRQARYYRATAGRGQPVTLDTAAECEAAHLASDPGWDAERAWNYSESRDAAMAEMQAELARRQEARDRG